MAGIIGSILKKRADHAQVKAEHEKSHPPLPHHTCLRKLHPFPQYPVKSLKTYTVPVKAPRPVTKLVGGAAVRDSVPTISGNNNWSQEFLDFDQKQVSFDDLGKIGEKQGDKRESNIDINAGISYATLYMGLVFISLGATLFFAGILDRKPGWHTLVLIILGPIIFFFGFLSAIFPIIKHLFPQLFPFIPSSRNKKKVERNELSIVKPNSSTTIDLSEVDVPPSYGMMIRCPVHSQNTFDPPRTPRVTLNSSKKSNLSSAERSSYSDFDSSEKMSVKQNHVSCQYEIQLEDEDDEDNGEKEEWDKKREIVITPKSYMPNHFS